MKATRHEALEAGERRYFTGLSCPHGHIAPRMVDNCGCTECHAIRREKNRDKQREYGRAHYKANREIYIEKAAEWACENAAKTRAAKGKWRRENKDASNAASRLWQSRNPDRARENAYRWRRENPEQFRAICLNRRARQAAAGGISADEIRAIVKRQKGRCVVCSKRAKLEMDHVMPLALGGSGHRHNFQGLCRSCNAKKNAKHPIDFNRSRGLLL